MAKDGAPESPAAPTRARGSAPSPARSAPPPAPQAHAQDHRPDHRPRRADGEPRARRRARHRPGHQGAGPPRRRRAGLRPEPRGPAPAHRAHAGHQPRHVHRARHDEQHRPPDLVAGGRAARARRSTSTSPTTATARTPSARSATSSRRGLADAVIFNQTRPDDPRVAWLMERRLPLRHARPHRAGPTATPGPTSTTRPSREVAVRRLARAGRRRIAVVAPPLVAELRAGHRRRASRPPPRPAGIEARVLPGVTSDGPTAAHPGRDGRGAGRGPAVDGLVCASTASAMAAVAALEGRGPPLGREIDLVAKEAIPFLTPVPARDHRHARGRGARRRRARPRRHPGHPRAREPAAPGPRGARRTPPDPRRPAR